MSQITADQYGQMLDRVSRHPAMAADNVNLPEGRLKGLSTVLIGIGVAGLLATVAGAVIYGNLKHAFAAYLVGVLCVTAASLGGLFWTMVFHQVNAGWSATVRRQFENLMMNLPLCMGLVAIYLIAELATGDTLLTWMKVDASTNHLMHHKKPWLNEPFLVVRFLVYAGVFSFLATRLWRLSTEQDRSGDRFLTLKARKTSAGGLLAFALCTAFFAFDFVMALDYRFFSTMFGVYFFASTAFSALCIVLLVTGLVRLGGRLTGAVSDEHVHDLGKLTFGFTVFWGYIAFSQYFLIWYSNIPEETAYFVYRKQGGWQNLSAILVIGHFLIPFLLLLQRPIKRHPAGVASVGVWLLVMLFLDMVWLVRPMVYVGIPAAQIPGAERWWLDIAGLLGVAGIWGGVLVARIGRGPLVPLKDPRLTESLEHRNYV